MTVPESQPTGFRYLGAAGTDVPIAFSVTIAGVDSLGILIVVAGASAALAIDFPQALGHELHYLA